MSSARWVIKNQFEKGSYKVKVHQKNHKDNCKKFRSNRKFKLIQVNDRGLNLKKYELGLIVEYNCEGKFMKFLACLMAVLLTVYI